MKGVNAGSSSFQSSENATEVQNQCFDKIISLYFGAQKITTRGAKKKGFFGLAQKPSEKLLKLRLIGPSYEKNT
jgi:hypothetical protein